MKGPKFLMGKNVTEHVVSDSRSFTRALVIDARGGDLCWNILVSRLHNLDLMSDLEQMSLPWLYAHWQELGRDVSALAIIRGMRRKMIVRNRLLLEGAREAASKLQNAGIDGAFIKGAGLLGSFLPEIGLRSMADIDLWIRPSQQTEGFAALGARRNSSHNGLHAEMIKDSSARQIDVHILPSHIFSMRKLSAGAAESMFTQAWLERPIGRLSDDDLVYFSILNNLFVHIPGETRAAFCLFELDAILRNQTDPTKLLSEMVKDARRDDTVSVFVEHLSWLGSGASPLLDELLKDMGAALTLGEQRRIKWLQDIYSSGENYGWHSRQARLFVHAEQSLPRGIGRFVLQHISDFFKSPNFPKNIWSIGLWKGLIRAAKDLHKMLWRA
ncbi:unannotated protein [freshwater metagenome]|uniref:Unannotated protein n=1 Tax=freshwater metagenome TaxID=449393 RepID=A0A6J6JAK6_9ZZZZ|nr:hypothetical protein [Actinomycetota bacterium]